jgi:hypothetical protein
MRKKVSSKPSIVMGGGMAYHYNEASEFFYHIQSLCKKDQYNLVLHKHLGDVFYAIGLKNEFEDTYHAKLHFIVRPQHEFLMKMYGIKNYTVYDLDSLIRKNKTFQKDYFGFITPTAEMVDRLENEMFQAMFSDIPFKALPFVCESPINNFFTYPHYWCYRWGSNMGISEDFKFGIPYYKPVLSEKAQQELNKIAPLDKIVLFAPEAATATEFAPEMWNIIAEKVHQHGYKIIVNSKKYKLKHGISAFDLGLSLEDVVALGLSCAYVFALRSGLCDVLVGARDKLYAFYPAMLHREMYSLTKCFEPDSNVHEIAVQHWKIDTVQWDGEDLTPALQQHFDQWKKFYQTEKRKYLCSFHSNERKKHKERYNFFSNVAGTGKIFPENNRDNPVEKRKKEVNISFLGLPLYRRIIQQGKDNQTITRYKVLGGLFSIKSMGHYWTARFCGIPIYSHSVKKDKLFFITVKRNKYQEKWLKRLNRKIPHEYDDIYILRNHIGETYAELLHIEDRIKAQKSQHPLIIVWDKKYFDFYKMFVPDHIELCYIPLKESEIHQVFNEKSSKNGDVCLSCKGRRFFCALPNIAETIKRLLPENPKLNFYSYIKACDGIPQNAKPLSIKIDTLLADKMTRRIARLGLGEKFVILCPEASTLIHLDPSFWQKITDSLLAKGYKVYANKMKEEYSLTGTITTNLSIAEIFLLAQKAKGIITLGSGLSIFLTEAHVPMDIIYTGFCRPQLGYDAEMAMRIYSVYHLPHIADNIYEYNADKQTADKLIKRIMKHY